MRWALAPCPLSVGWRSAWDHGPSYTGRRCVSPHQRLPGQPPSGGGSPGLLHSHRAHWGQGYASLTLGFLDGSDLAAGVPGIELVEPVFDARKIVVHTVRVNGVVVVVDGDETNTVLRKGEVGVKPGQRGVAAQSGKVFGDRHGHPSRLDFGQHGLKAGTVIGHTAYTVIHEKGWVGEVMLPGILQKHGLLRRDLSRLFSPAEYKCPTLL